MFIFYEYNSKMKNRWDRSLFRSSLQDTGTDNLTPYLFMDNSKRSIEISKCFTFTLIPNFFNYPRPLNGRVVECVQKSLFKAI